MCPQLGGTMIVGNGSQYILEEYQQLIGAKRYRDLLFDPTDHIERCNFHIATTCNSIHHTYHIARFEEAVKKNVAEMDIVHEVGGGYGNMARLFYTLGFKGKYVIHDLPTLVGIQKHYLGKYCPGMDVEWNNLDTLDPDLLVATWSISEIPISEREPFLNLNPKNLMIAFSHTFEEIRNLSEFENYYPNVKKTISEIEHLKGSYYMFGEVE